MEYIYTVFLTIILGIILKLTNPVMFLLYYSVTKLVFKVIKKDTKKLDDFYLAIPNFFNFTKITNFITKWIIMPPINFISWLPRAILSIVKFQTKVIEFLLVTVPKYVFKVVNFIVDNLIIGPIKFFTNYFIRLTDWIASGDASDYFTEAIIFWFELYFFQIQQLFNLAITSMFGHIYGNDPVIDVIRLPDDMFLLNMIKI